MLTKIPDSTLQYLLSDHSCRITIGRKVNGGRTCLTIQTDTDKVQYYHEELTDEQRKLISRWLSEEAEYNNHVGRWIGIGLHD